MYCNRQIKRLSLSGASSVASLIYALASERARALAALSSALNVSVRHHHHQPAQIANAKTSGRALVTCCQDRALHVTHILGHTVQCVLVQVMGTTGTVLSERVRTRKRSARACVCRVNVHTGHYYCTYRYST